MSTFFMRLLGCCGEFGDTLNETHVNEKSISDVTGCIS